MKVFYKVFPLFLLCLGLLYSEEEIVVQLNRSEPLVSVYLGSLDKKDSPLKSDHAKNLEDVLRFDLLQSGRITLQGKNPEKEALLSANMIKESLVHPIWKQDRTQYVVHLCMEESFLTAMIYSVEFTHLKTIKNIKVTGNLEEDRSCIHLLADQIHKILFNLEGIASTKILYTVQLPIANSSDREYSSQIWECDYDGANARKLTSDKNYCLTPIYYPKSKAKPQQFLYVTYEKGPSKIYISSLDDPNPEPFIQLRGNQLLPTISRDRSKIAFICDAGGRADLFVQPLHPERGLLGKPIQAYTFPFAVQASPTFSPDGKKIAFVSDKDKTPRIYLIEAPHYSKGRTLPEAQCLTRKHPENTCPNWSPDGKKLAYSAKIDGVRQIFIYDFETKEESQLTSGKSHKENPCWAPDSFHIVFNTADTHSSELHLVNLNQSACHKITSGPGKKHYPAWQP